MQFSIFFFFSSRRRHTRWPRDWSSDVCSSDLSGIQVFSPDGQRLLDLPVPEKVGNLCFGGEDGQMLYVVATTSLYRIATTTRDGSATAAARCAVRPHALSCARGPGRCGARHAGLPTHPGASI